MKMLRGAAIVAIVLAGLVLGTWILRSERQVVGEEADGGEETAADEGPHGGHLLRDGSFAAVAVDTASRR